MRTIILLALNDLRLVARDRSSYIWMIFVPIVFVLVFAATINRGTSGPRQPKISLVVENRDQGALAKLLIGFLDDKNVELVVIEGEAPPVDSESEIVRKVVIPENFTSRVQAGEEVSLEFVKASASDLEYDFAAELLLRKATWRLIGALLRDEGLESDEPGGEEESVAIEERARLVTLNASHAGRGRPIPSGLGQSVPGVLTQFVLMVVLMGGATMITEERRDNLLGRLAISPASRFELLAAKLLSYSLIGIMQTAILLVTGIVISASGLFGSEFYLGNDLVALLLVILAYVAAVGSMGLFIGAVMKTPQQVENFGWLACLPMAALGGCWWPMEIVPDWLATVGHAFPTAWMMDALHKLTSFGLDLSSVLPEILVLLAFALLFGFLGVRFLKFR